jgi:hypothetical protein
MNPVGETNNPQINFKLQNGNSINVEKQNFKGNLFDATSYIQNYCNTNDVTMKSLGWGYGVLKINGKEHSINRYGIDLKMMIEFCGKSLSDFS